MPLDRVSYIKIFPGIGMARVGNSPEYFIGPESPGVVPEPGDGKYKDEQGRLKPQAARFRVYGFDEQNQVVMEITSEVAELTWVVHVANKKAANYSFQGQFAFDPKDLRNSNIQGKIANIHERDKLIIDPGPKTITGPSAAPVPLDGGRIFDDITPNEAEGTRLELPDVLQFDPPLPPTHVKGTPVPVTYQGAEVSLGRLETDDQGRLIFIGGQGDAKSCTSPAVVIGKVPGSNPNPEFNGNSYFNNPGWYDDTCGGSINVEVTFSRDGQPFTLSTGDDAHKRGWVGVAPPNYAPTIRNVVSLLDLQLDMYPDEDPYNHAEVNFFRDIYPILKNVTDYSWVNFLAFQGHGPGQQGDFLHGEFLDRLANPSHPNGARAREFVFHLIRPPAPDTHTPPPPHKATTPKPSPTQTGILMPHLFGNGGSPEENDVNGTQFPEQWLSLTRHQYHKFEKWWRGEFVTGEPVTPVPLDELPLADQPRALNFAALEPTVGGGFHPGIELTYMMGESSFFAGPFRFAQPTLPGEIAAYMSIPWQGDFWSCNISWWPAIRPDVVIQYNPQAPGPAQLEPIPWFRGTGIPPAAADPLHNALPPGGQQPGYELMVELWSKLGLVLPVPGEFILGEQVFEERERDASLDV